MPDHDDAPAPPPLGDADYERLLAFRTALRVFLRQSEQIAAGSGLTPALHQLLLVIRGTGAAGTTVAHAADLLAIRHHSAVELAQRAEEHGLVARTRDHDDQRRVRLTLTDLGREQLEHITRMHLPEIGALARALSEIEATAETP